MAFAEVGSNGLAECTFYALSGVSVVLVTIRYFEGDAVCRLHVTPFGFLESIVNELI